MHCFIFCRFRLQRLPKSKVITFALLIRDETCKFPNFMSFYTWKTELRKKLKSDTELMFIDPTTNAQVKVFIGPKELKNGTHDVKFDDNVDLSHLVFVPDSDAVEGIQEVQVENEAFSVIPIWTITKTVLCILSVNDKQLFIIYLITIFVGINNVINPFTNEFNFSTQIRI